MSENPFDSYDLDKYNFVVKPGAPDYEERVLEFTLEDHIKQAKAFRAWEWDKWGATGELGPEIFEMADDNIRDMEEELEDAKFKEDFDKLTDEEVLYTARSWLINLTADNNADARKMGFSDEDIENFRAKIAAMEKAVENEKKANFRQEQDRINAASKKLLDKLGPSSKPIIFMPPKKPDEN